MAKLRPSKEQHERMGRSVVEAYDTILGLLCELNTHYPKNHKAAKKLHTALECMTSVKSDLEDDFFREGHTSHCVVAPYYTGYWNSLPGRVD